MAENIRDYVPEAGRETERVLSKHCRDKIAYIRSEWRHSVSGLKLTPGDPESDQVFAEDLACGFAIRLNNALLAEYHRRKNEAQPVEVTI